MKKAKEKKLTQGQFNKLKKRLFDSNWHPQDILQFWEDELLPAAKAAHLKI